MKKIITFLTVCTLLFASIGCNKNPLGVVKVTGTVKLDGNPVPGATVIFAPVDSGSPTASGKTDANGVFLVTSAGADGGTGAKPGEYLVGVSKMEVEDKTAGMTQEQIDAMPQDYTPAKVTRHIPQKYEAAQNSGLKASVSQAGPNEFTFELSSK